MGEAATLRFLVEGGKIKIQAQTTDHMISLELDEAELTTAFLLRRQGWSKALAGRLSITRPFRAVPNQRE